MAMNPVEIWATGKGLAAGERDYLCLLLQSRPRPFEGGMTHFPPVQPVKLAPTPVMPEAVVTVHLIISGCSILLNSLRILDPTKGLALRWRLRILGSY